MLEKGLNDVTEKIVALLEGGAVESARRASVHMALGVALATLGERERGTARLEQSVAAFTEALPPEGAHSTPRCALNFEHHQGSGCSITTG